MPSPPDTTTPPLAATASMPNLPAALALPIPIPAPASDTPSPLPGTTGTSSTSAGRTPSERPPGGTTRRNGAKTPRKVQWAQDFGGDPPALEAMRSLDDPRALATLTAALERHSLSPATFQATIQAHAQLPPQAQTPLTPITPLTGSSSSPLSDSPLLSLNPLTTAEKFAQGGARGEVGEAYIDPHERAGLPGQGTHEHSARAGAVVAAHRRGFLSTWARGGFGKEGKDKRVRKERKEKERLERSEKRSRTRAADSGESDVERTAQVDAGAPRRGLGGMGMLSALLTLYDHQDYGQSASTADLRLSTSTAMSTPRSESSADGSPISRTASRRSSLNFSDGLHNVARAFRAERPPPERNAAGVFGALVASTSNIAGAATPSATTVAPDIKRPGFHLSRYRMSDEPKPKPAASRRPQTRDGLGLGLLREEDEGASLRLSRPQSMMSLARPELVLTPAPRADGPASAPVGPGPGSTPPSPTLTHTNEEEKDGRERGHGRGASLTAHDLPTQDPGHFPPHFPHDPAAFHFLNGPPPPRNPAARRDTGASDATLAPHPHPSHSVPSHHSVPSYRETQSAPTTPLLGGRRKFAGALRDLPRALSAFSTPTASAPGSPRSEESEGGYFAPKLGAHEYDERRWEKEREAAERRERRRKRRKAEIFITRHVEEIIQRQAFLLKFARAMMMFGGPTHRLQAQVQSTARVLDVSLSCLYLPDVLLVSFDDAATATSSVNLIRQGSVLDLGKLASAHALHWAVIHDEMSVREASAELDGIMRRKPVYGFWTLVGIGGACSAAICTVSFNGSFIDALISVPLGALLVAVQLLSVRNELYSNVFEISIATMLSFVSAALANTRFFCYSAVASSSVVLILPGYIVLSGALELMSRNIISGSVRLCYALIYSLFLGFGLAIGAEVYEKMTGQTVYGPEDYSCGATHHADGAWWQRTPSLWWAFLTVPVYSLFLSMRQQAPWNSRELPLLVAISCIGWVTNHFVGVHFPNQTDVSSAVGAFAVGLVSNLYGRFFGGNAFSVMITGILFQLPSGLGNGGLLTFANKANSGDSNSYLSGFQTGLQLISVGIGLAVGLGVSCVIVYPVQSRRRQSGIFSL